MIQKLDKEGFVLYEKHRGVILTSEGEEVAKEVKKRHETLAKFVEFVQNAPHDPKWLEHFEHYVKTGEHLECDKENILKVLR